MKVYLVGRWIGSGTRFGFVGIFSQDWRGVEACRDDACFMVPFELDQENTVLDAEDIVPRYPALEDPFAMPITEPADKTQQAITVSAAESTETASKEPCP